MSEQFEMPFRPDYQGDKLAVVHTDTHTPVGVDNIQLVVQSDVDLNRQSEIIEGWKGLWEHMRDSNMLSSTSGPLYVARDIDAPKSGVRQLVDLVDVETTDIVLGVGADVNVVGENASQMHDSAFRMLREWAKENYFSAI